MQEGKLVTAVDSDQLQVTDPHLVGMDYLWALALDAPDAIASSVRVARHASIHHRYQLHSP